MFAYPSGIPTSTVETGEQWDFPNGIYLKEYQNRVGLGLGIGCETLNYLQFSFRSAWAPMMHLIIDSFRRANSPFIQEQAYMQSEKWVSTNYLLYKQYKAMYEKVRDKSKKTFE